MGIRNAILLADDSEDDELLFRRAVRISGLANPVIIVRDGEAAIAYLKGEGAYADREKHPLPTVLMLDLKMPRKNGFEVLQWVKQQPELKDLLVVVLTSSERQEELDRSYELGANSVLVKPCAVEDLQELAEGFPEHWTGPA
jgi:CheY-like chemotaxis protein